MKTSCARRPEFGARLAEPARRRRRPADRKSKRTSEANEPSARGARAARLACVVAAVPPAGGDPPTHHTQLIAADTHRPCVIYCLLPAIIQLKFTSFSRTF